MADLRCDVCARVFDNAYNLRSHQQSVGHMNVARLLGKGGGGGPPPPPPDAGGVGLMVRVDDRIATLEREIALTTGHRVSQARGMPRWVWLALGLGVVAVVVIHSQSQRGTRPGTAGTGGEMELHGPGGMGILPLGMAGIVGWLFLSRLARTELLGWAKALNEWAKS